MDHSTQTATSSAVKTPTILDALIPVVFVVAMLGATVYAFGIDSFGPNQVVLMLGAAIAALIGMKNGHKWEDIEQGMIDTISVSLRAVLILLMVGALIGSWILSGTVPSMIYYGVELMAPEYFYATTALVCALVGFSIGSSWTVAGTLGIGMVSIATALDLSLPITAGAIVSGAYMGDKLSPLSDTTNLAAAVTRNDLFAHIQHMLWTTIPAFTIAMILFFFLGLGADSATSIAQIEQLQSDLKSTFTINLAMLLPLVLLLTMAVKKLPALMTLICGTVCGCLFALIFQYDAVLAAGASDGLSTLGIIFKGIFGTMYSGYSASTDSDMLNELLSKGGMSSMLGTIGLIICALSFGGAMQRTGLLKHLVDSALARTKSIAGLIATTVGTCFGTNVLAADQYLSIVIPGQMFNDSYRERGLKTINLSRTLEDAGTLTSVLVPWNTCGAYFTATLGISTWQYAPYAFLNYICPLLAITYGILLFKLPRLDEGEQDNRQEAPSAERAVASE